jgi:hypothetical protein
MKNLILLSMVFLMIACGKDGDDKPYLFPVSTMNKVWTKSHTIGSPVVKFDTVDMTNLNAVTFTNVDRQGVQDDCVLSATTNNGRIYGIMNFTLVSGDLFVCSQLVGQVGYHAVMNTKRGYEYMHIHGQEVR